MRPSLRARGRKPLASINLTPLIDVLLILIVIFMLAMPMFVKQMAVELPKTTLIGTPSVAHSLLLEIDHKGNLWAQGDPITWNLLEGRIDASVSVQIAADYRVQYGELTDLVQKVQSKAPRDISLLVR